MATPLDQLGRRLHDLRISVTDRCNLRCGYCMPSHIFDTDFKFLPSSALLSFEELTHLAQAFANLGVEKLRITGGEPLLRREIEVLIAMLVGVRGIQDVALTTNGLLLPSMAEKLRAAGLQRITVSLDSLDDAVFGRMNGRGVGVQPVLDGISAAKDAGFESIKINMVVQKGVNDHEVEAMAERWRGTGIIVRFIEFMDVGTVNGWDLSQVVSSAEIVRRISKEHELVAIDANYGGEVAQRWRYVDGSGEIGVISSVTHAFCGTCTRARLSAKGELYTCLFASMGTDLGEMVKSGASVDELTRFIGNVWRARGDRYSEVRLLETRDREANGDSIRRVEMSYIGG